MANPKPEAGCASESGVLAVQARSGSLSHLNWTPHHIRLRVGGSCFSELPERCHGGKYAEVLYLAGLLMLLKLTQCGFG
jgi:hypothetical protein